MTTSSWSKILKQIKTKKEKSEKFIKHNKPKDRKNGVTSKRCERCQRIGAHISSYGINLCRQCFREIAEEIGFKKYS